MKCDADDVERALGLLRHLADISDADPVTRRGARLADAYEHRLAELADSVEKHQAALNQAQAKLRDIDDIRLELVRERCALSRAKFSLDYESLPANATRARLARLCLELFAARSFAQNMEIHALGVSALEGTGSLIDALNRALKQYPVLDRAWYQDFYGETPETDKLFEFVVTGVDQGRAPCIWFDYSFYVESAELGEVSNGWALLHFLIIGAANGLDPSPEFSVRYYLLENQDVAEAGVNPLAHFVQFGQFEGRSTASRAQAALIMDPSFNLRDALNDVFDEGFYQTRYPDVAASGLDPLYHYLNHGEAEGRDISAWVSADVICGGGGDAPLTKASLIHRLLAMGANARSSKPISDDVAPLLLEPLRFLRVVDVADREPRPVQNLDGPLLVCMTHVLPWPRRAGNEYRTGRLLDWFQSCGYRVVVVLVPLHEPISDVAVRDVADRYGDVAVVERDGVVRLLSRSGRVVLDHINGGLIRPFDRILDEPLSNDVLVAERTFCHDAAIETMLGLQCIDDNILFYVNYIWMSRWLGLLVPEHRVFIDMHDLFSSKKDQVVNFGVQDSLLVPSRLEAEMLARGDAVVAINGREADLVRAMLPDHAVIAAGVDFDVEEVLSPPKGKKIVALVGSGNALNLKGLTDFLRLAWPAILAAEPTAELHVAGSICRDLAEDLPGVKALGRPPSLLSLYESARCVVNPVVAGTGLKVKTVEALAHRRRVVGWPNGLDGLDQKLMSYCHMVTTWPDFAREVVEILRLSSPEVSSEDASALDDRLSANFVYADLQAWVERPHPGFLMRSERKVTTAVSANKVDTSKLAPQGIQPAKATKIDKGRPVAGDHTRTSSPSSSNLRSGAKVLPKTNGTKASKKDSRK